MRFNALVRALRARNYRLFFSGQSVSLIGTWMTRTATIWLVYRLTGHSEWMLGLVTFLGQLPTFILGPLAGVLVDRYSRHRMLVLTQVLFMVTSLLLAGLTLSGLIQIWHVIVLSVAQGVVAAFDMPARQAFLLEMVEDASDIPNAIALNSSMFNGARLLGPALAGPVIQLYGEGICFLVDGVSYVAVIASLLAMALAARSVQKRGTELWSELREGFAYVFGFPPLRAILLLLTLASIMGMSYVVLMPYFATQILHGTAQTFGWLLAAPGLGALFGALFLASRTTVRGLGAVIAWSGALFGAALVGFASSHTLWLSLALLLVSGFGMMVQVAACNTILQTIAAEDKRGRVMSFYTMSLIGVAPFGSLLAGGLADVMGAPATLRLSGLACILGSLVFLRKLPAIRKILRPIYIEKGIIAIDD